MYSSDGRTSTSTAHSQKIHPTRNSADLDATPWPLSKQAGASPVTSDVRCDRKRKRSFSGLSNKNEKIIFIVRPSYLLTLGYNQHIKSQRATRKIQCMSKVFERTTRICGWFKITNSTDWNFIIESIAFHAPWNLPSKIRPIAGCTLHFGGDPY